MFYEKANWKHIGGLSMCMSTLLSLYLNKSKSLNVVPVERKPTEQRLHQLKRIEKDEFC